MRFDRDQAACRTDDLRVKRKPEPYPRLGLIAGEESVHRYPGGDHRDLYARHDLRQRQAHLFRDGNYCWVEQAEAQCGKDSIVSFAVVPGIVLDVEGPLYTCELGRHPPIE